MNADNTFCDCYFMLIKCREENIFSQNLNKTLSFMKIHHPRIATVKVLQNDCLNINLKSTLDAIINYHAFHEKLRSNNC